MKDNLQYAEWLQLRHNAEQQLYPNDYCQFVEYKEDLVDCGYTWKTIKELLIDYIQDIVEDYAS